MAKSELIDASTALPSGAMPTFSDIQTRQQSALAAMGRMAATHSDGMRLIRDGAALVAESMDADFYLVSQIDTEENSLVHQLGVNTRTRHPDEHPQEYRTSRLRSSSLAGYSMEVRQPLVIDDLPADARTDDLFLRSKGIRSALVQPLEYQKQPVGAIAVLNRKPLQFSAHDVLFIEMIANQVILSIGRERSERALAAEQRFTATLMEAVEALVLVLDDSGRIVRINGACQPITGFTQRDAVARSFCSTLLVPEEASTVRAYLNSLQAEADSVDFESFILTRGGVRRRIAWSFARYCEDDDFKLIGTGIDVTDLRQSQIELQQMQHVASESTRQLNDLLAKINRGQIPKTGHLQASHFEQPFQALPDGPHGERRLQPRRSYPYVQLMAPLPDNQLLPDRSDLREIRCREITGGGFSYLSAEMPDYESIVVAFGIAPALTYVTARIVHATPIDHDGQTAFAVGCVYTGRAKY